MLHSVRVQLSGMGVRSETRKFVSASNTSAAWQQVPPCALHVPPPDATLKRHMLMKLRGVQELLMHHPQRDRVLGLWEHQSLEGHVMIHSFSILLIMELFLHFRFLHWFHSSLLSYAPRSHFWFFMFEDYWWFLLDRINNEQ